MAKSIVLREEYKNSKGEDQVSWNPIGLLIDGKEGKQYVKLNHIPGVLLHCFEIEKKEKPAENSEGQNF